MRPMGMHGRSSRWERKCRSTQLSLIVSKTNRAKKFWSGQKAKFAGWARALYEVIEEHCVTKTLMRAKELYDRWDDAWDSALTVLGHDPDGLSSDQMDETEYRLLEIPKAASVQFPGVAVIYKV